MVLTLYLQRLIFHHIPPSASLRLAPSGLVMWGLTRLMPPFSPVADETIISSFLPLGPCASREPPFPPADPH